MSVIEPAYAPYRRLKGKSSVMAGVCAGLAGHLGVPVQAVRIAFVLLSLFAGFGLVLYCCLWVVTKAERDLNAVRRPISARAKDWVLLFIAIVGGIGVSAFLTVPEINLVFFGAVFIIAVGAVLAWFAFDSQSGKSSFFVVLLGAFLVLVGVVIAVSYWETQAVFGTAFVSVLITLLGVGVLAVPFGLRVWDGIITSRNEKTLADERAAVASKLHDSVLQTLALIQKRASDPEEVVRLARGQERELRQWLFDPERSASDRTLFAAINRACGEVEDMFGVRIAPVLVGEDVPFTERYRAMVLAAREAMVNAAKHAGVTTVDVYAEVFETVSIYVRDRGKGFDINSIPVDRHGVRDSIIERVARAGGAAVVRPGPGEIGTEVEIVAAIDHNEKV